MRDRRIRELRLGLGLSQERFARLLSVSLQTVRRWENGLTRPLPIISMRLEELEKQAEAAAQRRGGAPMTGRRRGAGGIEVDLGYGLGGLFKGIGSLVDLVSKMAEQGAESATRTGTVEALGGRVKGVYGFTVRVGLEGRPIIEQFGNIQETETGPVVTETREPLVDVLDEGSRVLVIVELPGVEERDVQLEVQGDILVVTASSQSRKYYKEVLLPAPVDPGSLESSYRNGVLEVRLMKTEDGRGSARG